MPTGKPFNPAGVSKPSVGQALYDLGFRSTRWIPRDGQVGETKGGAFDPTSNSPIQRYGNPLGLGVKGWPPEQYTGMHSTGQNRHAILLAPKVLGAAADPQQDAADLNFVQGATQYVLQQAYEQAKTDSSLYATMYGLGMYDTQPAEPPVKPPTKPVPPVTPPTTPPVVQPPSTTPVEQRVDELQAMIRQERDKLHFPMAVALINAAFFSDVGRLFLTRAVQIYRKVMALP